MVLHGSSRLVPSIDIPGKRCRGYVSAAVIREKMGYGMILEPSADASAHRRRTVVLPSFFAEDSARAYERKSRDGLVFEGRFGQHMLGTRVSAGRIPGSSRPCQRPDPSR